MVLKMRRFTPEEDRLIIKDWENHVLLGDIASKIGRSPGVVRQRVRYLKLRRSGSVTRAMKWAPPHLLAKRKRVGDDEFVRASHEWRRDERQRPDVERRETIARMAKKIDAQASMSRSEKILAKRKIGMTLQEIGDELGITRQAVLKVVRNTSRDQGERTAKRLYETFAGLSPEAKVSFVRRLTQAE